jgi:hypothetical protein
VTLAGLGEQHFSGRRYLEALFSAGLRLQLGHLALLLPRQIRLSWPGLPVMPRSNVERRSPEADDAEALMERVESAAKRWVQLYCTSCAG